MKTTPAQLQYGFRSIYYTLEELITFSKGKYKKKVVIHYKTWYFVCLNPEGPRLFTQYISKDGKHFRVDKKLTRHQVIANWNILAADLDKILSSS